MARLRVGRPVGGPPPWGVIAVAAPLAHGKNHEWINKWLIDNSLFMHKGKTECMLFGTGPRLALSTSFL